METSDEQLIQRIRGKDRDALAEFLERRRGALLGFIRNKMSMSLQGKVEPEDILQEACTSILQSYEEVDFEDRDPFNWFCQMAERRLIDVQRRFAAKKRSAEREVRIQGAADATQAGLINLLAASITSPSAAFSRKQREFKLLEALSRLPDEQQKVLRLRFGENLPSKEIAQAIGKTDGATRVLITRSLKKLELVLAEIETDMP